MPQRPPQTSVHPEQSSTVASATPATDAFAFGANWTRFLKTVDEHRIQAAADSLTRMLGEGVLAGKRFLDAGCGSGLFSLAAVRLGARVTSFDVDFESVACAEEMRRRFAEPGAAWTVVAGSLLDESFLAGLGEFDVVYSWGVVHHTGSMWQAIDNLQQRVAPRGTLWLAIYNDQGPVSRRWSRIKRGYNRLPSWLHSPYVVVVGGVWALGKVCCRLGGMGLSLLTRLISFNNSGPPLKSLRDDVQRQSARGMHPWYDLVDWIGGWPFEVAKPEEVLHFLRERGFELVDLNTCGGRLGCNEYLFRRRN